MEVDGNTAASVKDASYLRKDTVVDEKLNNAVVPIVVSNEVELIKKSDADCSSTVDTMVSEKESEEKDDLLEQIEEVCSNKASNIKNTEDMSKTSEHEFLKKIEEMEKNDGKVTQVSSEKATNVVQELKAKKILECEATSVEAVVVGDKVMDVKDDIANHVEESKTLAPKEKQNVNSDSAPCPEVLNIDTMVSSTRSIQVTKDKVDIQSIYETTLKEETALSECDMENNIEKTDTKSDISIGKVEDKMELENDAVGGLNDMDIDAKEQPSDDDVEMVFENQVKLKPESISESSEKAEVCEIEIKGTSIIIDSKSIINIEGIQKNTIRLEDSANHEKVDLFITKVKADSKNLPDLKTKEHVVSSSLTNTPLSSTNVFNSTPIQKQFEVSSENVSKISDTVELSRTEKEDGAIPSKHLTKSFEDSTTESGTCATSETDHLSSDGTMKKYIDAIKKYNGMPDTTTDEEEPSTPAKKNKTNENFDMNISYLSGTDLKRDSTYEVSVCCDRNDVRYLSIERIDLSTNNSKNQTDKAPVSESSVQSSSNGSVTSLQPYQLPQTIETPSSVSTSFSTYCHSLITSRDKHTILGIEELCNFMINQFTKIKHAINPEIAKDITVSLTGPSTPTQQIKKNKKTTPSSETALASASKAKRVRKRSLQEEEVESTPKAKQTKRDTIKENPKSDEVADSENMKGPCVLAKWVDKKFYAGKITGEKPGSKYVVLFEDGASKTLPKESIVFGEDEILPLQDQNVYALVEEDYESGIVLSIEKSNNKVFYNVKTENTTVKVTASDIYLEIDQAKEIQKIQNAKICEGVEEEESTGTRPSRNKRPPASPSTPEAGYSGSSVGKRGGKRQKRYS